MNKRYAFYGFLTGLFALLLMGAKITSNILQLGRGTAEDISIQFNTGTANQPLIKWDNTASVLKFSNNGTDFFNFGSGSGGGVGGLNYIENGDFEGLNITGWDEYADAAAATPADGTGGTPNITASFSNVTPLNGDGQLRISKDAANRQGEGISYAFTVPQGYRQGRKAGISFVVDASTANYAAGDLAVYVYDVTNAILITPTVAAIPKAKTPISIAWDQSTGTDFRLIFHITSTNATAYDVYLDDIVIGPKFPGQVPTITPVTSYTPTISGFGTATSVNFEYWQTGEVVSIRGTWTNGTVAGTTASISLPNSWTAAENKIVGRWYRQVAVGTTRKAGTLYSSVGSNLLQFASDDYTSTTAPYNDSLAGNAVSGNTNEMVVVIDGVAINQLVGAGGGYIGQNNVQYLWSTATGTAANTTYTTGTGYGPDGVLFNAIASTTSTTVTVYEITTQQPIQETDEILVEIKQANGSWAPPSVTNIATGSNNHAGCYYGIGATKKASTTNTIAVTFGNCGAKQSESATFGANGAAWSTASTARWRVKVMSGGNAVGFGFADASNSGLLSTSAQTIAGQKTFNDLQTIGSTAQQTVGGSFHTINGRVVIQGNQNSEHQLRVFQTHNDGFAFNAVALSATPSVTAILSDWNFSGTNDPSSGGARKFMNFRDNDTSTMGSITAATATTIAFNTSSDERLKENIEPMENGLERVLQLEPSSFNWKQGGHYDEGFIAQNVKTVYPYAVSGDEKSDPMKNPMQVDYGKLTPLLAAAIKDLAEQNKQLQNEIEQLKRLIEEK